jgi:integrase
VNRIKPPAKGQVDHFDKGFPGLALRVSYAGGRSWSLHYRIAGRLHRMSLGTYPALSLADDREAWREARKEVAQGRDPATVRKRDKPANDFVTVSRDWLRRDQGKNKSRHEVERILERELIPAWGHRAVGDIRRRDVLDLLDGIVDRGAPTMARRTHAYIHRFFRWSIGRGIIEANPAASLPMQGSETRRERVLTDDELALVWRASMATDSLFGSIYRLLILTGARRGEIGGLRWTEIIDGDISLSGERTKNGQPHVIPLAAPARAIIEELPHFAGSPFAFGLRTPTGGAWDRAKAKLDAAAADQKHGEPIAPWRVHDLRRTVATGLQRLSFNLQVIEAVLGHISGSRSGVVAVYQRHSFADEKREALEAWGAHVMALSKP